MRYDVSVIGLYILDVLGRPVTRIPDRGNVDFIEEIRLIRILYEYFLALFLPILATAYRSRMRLRWIAHPPSLLLGQAA